MTQVVPSSGGNVYVASDALVQTITSASNVAVRWVWYSFLSSCLR